MNSHKTVKKPLLDNTRAEIFFQLSRLEEVGFSAQQAFELLKKSNPTASTQITLLQQYLKAGHRISESGYRAGVFSELDKDLLHAGESSGNIRLVYKQLAHYYDQKVKRIKKIKAKSYFPLAILVIALFVQPLPALILNEISIWNYLLVSLGQLSKIIILFYLMIKLPFWLTQGKLQFLGLKNPVYQLQLRLPFISSWVVNRQINTFFQSLGLMLTAGMPILDALPKAIMTINNPTLKNQFNPSITATANGQSLTTALTNVDGIDSQQLQLLSVGETSGKLAKTILHFTKIKSELLELQEDLLAEWLPRIFYFIVTCWVATSLIDNGMTQSL